MKLIIAGGRDFHDKELVFSTMKGIEGVTEIVCGGARGADALGAIWAAHHGIPIALFEANWTRHGKAAGPIRNRQMATYADALLAFWDGESRGTKNMIKEAESMSRIVYVVRYVRPKERYGSDA